MNKAIHLSVFLFLFSFGFKNANANHMLGADATWKCLGNDTFEITLVVYRRCTDGAVSLTIYPPTITSDSCGSFYTATTSSLLSHMVDDITPTCATYQKFCPSAGGTGVSTPQIPIGIERHTLVYKVYLGGIYANCCWYKLSWQQSSRTTNITNGYANTNFIDEFWLNRCVCNNSPRFTGDILSFKCAGQDVKYNLGMVDDEKDSLTYSLTAPLGGSYTSPWNASYPINCLGGNNPNPNSNPPTGFNIDPLTGDISFRPMQVSISVLKITVTEWRNISGVAKVIGVTNRELVIVIVINCNNSYPTLSSPYNYSVCSGSQLCFTIDANDANSTDSTWINSNSSLAIPASSFTITMDTGRRSHGIFCWTPGDSDVRDRPYYFQASANDNHCLLIGKTSRTYSIAVRTGLAITTKMESVACANYNFIASSNDPSAIKKWEIYKGAALIDSIINKDIVLNYKFNATGTYYIKYSAVNFCSSATNTDTVVITNATSLNIMKSSDTTICPGDSVTLTVSALSGSSPYTYKWYLDGALVNSSQTFKTRPTKSADYIVEVVSSDTCKINKTDTIKVIVNSLRLKVSLNRTTTVCYKITGYLVPSIDSGTAPFNFKWYQNGILISTAPILPITLTSNQDYVVNIVSADQCINQFQDTIHVTVDSSVLLTNPFKDTTICKGSRLDITPAIIRGTAPFQYFWYDRSGVVSTASTLSINPTSNSTYILVMISADKCYRWSTDSIHIIIDTSQLLVQALRDTTICMGSPLDYTSSIITGKAPLQFLWYKNGVLVSSSPIIIPLVSSVYDLAVVSADNCFNQFFDTVLVSVFPSKQLTLTAGSTNINKGQSTVLKSNGRSNFNWTGPDIITNWNDSVLVKPIVTTTYTLICSNLYGCDDTAQITINVTPVGVQSMSKVKGEKLKINPNPAFDKLTVDNGQLTVRNAEYRIYNALGQVCLMGMLNGKETIVDITSLASGIYFVRVGDEVRKFVKK